MERPLIAGTIFIATLLLSIVLVSRAIVIGRRAGLMDQPGPRRVHTVPVPRTGGLAIFLAFAAGISFTVSFDIGRSSAETERLLLLLTGAAIISIVMLVDDAVGLAPLSKLGWQIGVAALVVLPRLRGVRHGISIDTFNAPLLGQVRLPLAIALVVTLIWIVGMMNTLNWIDGLDGLAASVTLVTCGILVAHTYFWPRDNPQFTISLIPLALGAATLGFLLFNWHPAKVIMGDAGSNMLGFSLAIAAVIGGAKIATALLALGLPILDVAWVILVRLRTGRSPLVADRGHLHHRLLDDGWSQARIVGFVAGTSIVFGMAALLLPTKGAKLGAMVLLGVVLLALTARLAAKEKGRQNGGPAHDVAPEGNRAA